jgi:hypothetical protein
MECPFIVGQKVACLEDEWVDYWTGVDIPRPLCPAKGGVYRIMTIRECSWGIVLGLKEFQGINDEFDHRAFRPLQDRPKEADTDISVFGPIVREKVDA